MLGAASPAARALEIEITGGGADRLERQKAWARGALPLPGTPDLTRMGERLAALGLKEGDPVFVRIFKSESELELWMRKGEAFVHFATYPICQWSGVLGPKIYEGDNQSPEGFYTIQRNQLKWRTRHHRAFNIGFPNAFDRVHARTGSNILVHGGCSTEGCFAMTNPVIEEVFRLTQAALNSGQREAHVHVFPFRMTEERLAAHADSAWHAFWLNLRTGYDLFEAQRVPPTVRQCKGAYTFAAAGSEPPPAADCDSVPGPPETETAATEATSATTVHTGTIERPDRKARRGAVKGRRDDNATGRGPSGGQRAPQPAPMPEFSTGLRLAPGETWLKADAEPAACNLSRTSCRRWMAMQAASHVASADHRSDHRTAASRTRRGRLASR